MDVSLDCCQRPQTLPDDILILIARELKRAPHLDGLRNMSCISRRLRLLCLPILFEHSYMQYPSIMGTLDPPEAIRPYVQRLLCRQVYTKTPSDDFYKSYLGFFPNLKHVRFEGMPEGISPSIMDICLEKVTSLDVAYEARWKATTPINQTLRTPYSVVNQLSHFSLASHCFRELVSHLGRVDLEAEYALESRCLAKLVCDMHSTAELLSLPMETAPLRQMLELPWPRIRSFALHGRHLTLDQASALPAVLSHMPSLRTLRVQAAQPSSLSRNPILGISCTTLAVELRELRSLTVAYPNPDDPIFSLKTPHLTHLSLRDEPRYYFHLRNTELIPSSIAAPILKASECLTILRKKDVPLLTSLEVVYEADAEEDELLRHISSAYPNLAQLELHRYRASDCDCSDDRDPYVSDTSPLQYLLTSGSAVPPQRVICDHFFENSTLEPRLRGGSSCAFH
ncbi:hypothetical protein C8Q70DRAFT_945373 [Cubamyces menziesii]|nr:hypothetical protein C8Q70DRAFT_945373 [Cubamyces menziesii]